MKKPLLLAGILWAICLTAGLTILSRYSSTPGAGAVMKGDYWPVTSKIKRSDRPFLIVFAHPYCPCSDATIAELERLMPSLKDKVDVLVMFVQPKERPLSWVQGPSWKTAQNIPGVKVMNDFDYYETDIFGAKTSGQVIFFNPNGLRIYSGGITPSRGHMGDSPGRDALLSWVEGRTVKRQVASVFGCSLRELAENK